MAIEVKLSRSVDDCDVRHILGSSEASGPTSLPGWSSQPVTTLTGVRMELLSYLWLCWAPELSSDSFPRIASVSSFDVIGCFRMRFRPDCRPRCGDWKTVRKSDGGTATSDLCCEGWKTVLNDVGPGIAGVSLLRFYGSWDIRRRRVRDPRPRATTNCGWCEPRGLSHRGLGAGSGQGGTGPPQRVPLQSQGDDRRNGEWSQENHPRHFEFVAVAVASNSDLTRHVSTLKPAPVRFPGLPGRDDLDFRVTAFQCRRMDANANTNSEVRNLTTRGNL